MNDYFNPTGHPGTGSSGLSEIMRSQFALISAGFDKFPALTGHEDEFLVINASGTGVASLTVSEVVAALGVTVGSNFQPLDADLTAIAALTSGANAVPYATGPGAWSLMTVTPAARALMDDVDSPSMLVTLGAKANSMSSARLLGRTTAAAGAIEEISVGAGLSLSSGSLVCTVVGSSPPYAISDITGLQTAIDGKAATSHTHAEADVTGLTADLAAKAPLASPTFTGTPAAPTAAPGTNTTQIASTAFVTAAAGAGAASQAEMETATDLTKFSTPGLQQHHPLHPKAWGRPEFVAGAYQFGFPTHPGISAIGGSAGNGCLVTLSPVMTDTNFPVLVTPHRTAGVPISFANVESISASQFRVRCYDAAGTIVDVGFDVVVWGDQ